MTTNTTGFKSEKSQQYSRLDSPNDSQKEDKIRKSLRAARADQAPQDWLQIEASKPAKNSFLKKRKKV